MYMDIQNVMYMMIENIIPTHERNNIILFNIYMHYNLYFPENVKIINKYDLDKNENGNIINSKYISQSVDIQYLVYRPTNYTFILYKNDSNPLFNYSNDNKSIWKNVVDHDTNWNRFPEISEIHYTICTLLNERYKNITEKENFNKIHAFPPSFTDIKHRKYKLFMFKKHNDIFKNKDYMVEVNNHNNTIRILPYINKKVKV